MLERNHSNEHDKKLLRPVEQKIGKERFSKHHQTGRRPRRQEQSQSDTLEVRARNKGRHPRSRRENEKCNRDDVCQVSKNQYPRTHPVPHDRVMPINYDFKGNEQHQQPSESAAVWTWRDRSSKNGAHSRTSYGDPGDSRRMGSKKYPHQRPNSTRGSSRPGAQEPPIQGVKPLRHGKATPCRECDGKGDEREHRYHRREDDHVGHGRTRNRRRAKKNHRPLRSGGNFFPCVGRIRV